MKRSEKTKPSNICRSEPSIFDQIKNVLYPIMTIWKTQKYFSFSFFSSPQKTIEKTKISLFDQNYSEIINSMNFIIFLFQSDKNDENKNLRMNEINWKQLILFNLIVLNESCFCWIEFFNWWISSFSSDWFFSNWGIQSNHQRDESESSIWLKYSFLPVEKIIFFQMNYQSQWNDNWFIIEFFLSISISDESFE